MREQKQKTARRTEQAQPETQPEDQRDEKLDQETADVLDEIACCLAEVEDEDLAAKKAAKAEWDENARQVRAYEIDTDTYWFNRRAWVLKYSSMFEMYDCCGVSEPDFGDLE